ncbi:MAG: PAS domain S-box protein [Pseudomonadota bacterium]|nr:PAS domain S-box protein [Pseudomonadota bacterium]
MLNSETRSATTEDGRFRLAMASSGIGMAIVDLQGRWLEVNPALERMLGYAAGDLVRRSLLEISHPDDIETSRQDIDRMARGELSVLEVPMRYLHRNGAVVWAQVNMATMCDADGTPLYFIAQLRDISRERAAEQALQERTATLEQRVAERTAELDRSYHQQELFAQGVSHDLRAPLRAIDSFTQLLAKQYDAKLDETGRGYLERIRTASARLGGLIDALVELSRAGRSELKVEPVDLSLLADWAAADQQELDPERTAEISVQPGMVVLGDERLLKRLLDQLLDNAWKFSRGADRVRIEVAGARGEQGLVVSVRDQGLGFDMRYADKLFEPFQRLHGPEQGGGNGLGLAIATRIVERHGGRLWAESEPGSGATFHVALPAPADQPLAKDPKQAPA